MHKKLYLQVLAAILMGIVLGHYFPATGEMMKPLGDGFIKLIKMLIAPIIFCTVVSGIAGIEDMKKIGRVGVKALVYFELVTTFALVIGLAVVNMAHPGRGINADPATLDMKSVESYSTGQKQAGAVEFLLDIIPSNIVDAFAKGNVLEVLLFSVLLGFALSGMGQQGKTLLAVVDQFSRGLFGVVAIIMKLAPLGAFGAMAFTIGKYGIGTLISLGKLMACFYGTCILFIFIVLGLIARFHGFSIWKFLKYISEEILIVLATSSSEAVLPRMIAKLEGLGCSRSVVGLVVPTGYSFNLDGTSIYLTMAAIFIAQATNTDLSIWQEVTILGVLLLTSKGAAAVTGGGLITLAATLSSVSSIPVAGIALILGIDRFMSEARAITNLIGNGIATVVIAKWENELDVEKMNSVLNDRHQPEH